ncbi:MAG: hypothetical protein WB802_06055 [Candidatus Dormiibacterota bacterium]
MVVTTTSLRVRCPSSFTRTPDSSADDALMVSADLDADPPLWESAPVPTTALPELELLGPETAEEDAEADDDPSDEGETHAAAAVGTAEVVADGAVEAAVDELPVSVAEVANPHAEALSEATTTTEESAHPGANLMPPRIRP